MFFFRTQYNQYNPRSRSELHKGIMPGDSNTYGSYVIAKDKEEALVKMSNRNLNEILTVYCDPTPLDQVKPEHLVDALTFFDKQHYKHCLHAVTFMVFVLDKAGRASAQDAISDIGVIHELIHLSCYPETISTGRVRKSIEYVQGLYYELSH